MKLSTVFAALSIIQAESEDAFSLLQRQSKFVLNTEQSSDISLSRSRSPEEFCNGDFKLTEPSVNTLDQPGGMIKYPGVTAGVDLVVSQVGGTYQPYNAGMNGIKNGFGNINMLAGTEAVFEFTFVKTGTDEPVTVPKVSCSFYDMDEGKRGKGRGSIATCGAEASFIPSTTELSQVRGADGCFKTNTCLKGAKGNEPTSPDDVTPDALKRTFTYSYADKSSFTIKMGSTKGHKGRNYHFSLDPIGACRVTTTTTTTTTTVAGPATPQCPPMGGPLWSPGPYKMCRVIADPIMETSFFDHPRTFHQGMQTFGVQRAAKSKDGSFELQTFHVPYGHVHDSVSVVGGVAFKIGDNVYRYIAPSHNQQYGALKYANGTEIKGNTLIDGASIMFSQCSHHGSQHFQIRSDHSQHRVITDHAGNWALVLAVRNFSPMELGFQLFMKSDFIDTSILGNGYSGSYCGDGVETSQPNASRGVPFSSIDVHDLQTSLFGATETDYICKNLMTFGAATTPNPLMTYQTCGDWENQIVLPVGKSAEDTCKGMGIDFAEAKNACTGFNNDKVVEACQMEYCNDAGKLSDQQIRDIAEEDENGLEKEQEDEAAFERSFAPPDCCAKYSCDKTIGLSM